MDKMLPLTVVCHRNRKQTNQTKNPLIFALLDEMWWVFFLPGINSQEQ